MACSNDDGCDDWDFDGDDCDDVDDSGDDRGGDDVGSVKAFLLCCCSGAAPKSSDKRRLPS